MVAKVNKVLVFKESFSTTAQKEGGVSEGHKREKGNRYHIVERLKFFILLTGLIELRKEFPGIEIYERSGNQG